MARHNREGRGTDQRGEDYDIGYQPDWLRQIKVTRNLESGRQSTKTLFRNPGYKEQPPGQKVRTRIKSPHQKVDFEVSVDDPRGIIKKITIETVLPDNDDVVTFSIEEELPPPNGNGDGDPDGDGGS